MRVYHTTQATAPNNPTKQVSTNAWNADHTVGPYNAGVTGSVDRDLDDKLGDVPSVKDFGATGDGATDDNAAFVAAPDGALVPVANYSLSTDVDGRFLSLGPARVVGNGSADIRDVLDAIPNQFAKSQAPLEIIAHRGFTNQAPQNTLLAMSMALKRGADSLECDVQVSSDGVLYLFHDATVDALTSGTGTFTALASSYIDGLTFDALAGSALPGVRITRFENFLRFAREAGVRVYPEIKAYRTQADIALMVNAVVNADMEELCMFQSFNLSDLQYVRGVNSRIEVGYLGSSTTPATYQQAVKDMAALGRSSILWAYASLLSTPAIVDYAYKRGVGVGTWTVNTYEEARQLMRIGVRKIMSDVSLGRADR